MADIYQDFWNRRANELKFGSTLDGSKTVGGIDAAGVSTFATQKREPTERELLEKALWLYGRGRPAGPLLDEAPIIAAARKHLDTLPKPPRLVDVWYVEYVYDISSHRFSTRTTGPIWKANIKLCETLAQAEELADRKRRAGRANVRITGPHKRELPPC